MYKSFPFPQYLSWKIIAKFPGEKTVSERAIVQNGHEKSRHRRLSFLLIVPCGKAMVRLLPDPELPLSLVEDRFPVVGTKIRGQTVGGRRLIGGL